MNKPGNSIKTQKLTMLHALNLKYIYYNLIFFNDIKPFNTNLLKDLLNSHAIIRIFLRLDTIYIKFITFSSHAVMHM